MRCSRIGANALRIEFHQGSVAPLELNFDLISTSPEMCELARDAFEQAAGPGGTWRSRATLRRNYGRLKTFFQEVPELHEHYPDPNKTKEYLDRIGVHACQSTLFVLRYVFQDDPRTPSALKLVLESMRVQGRAKKTPTRINSEQFVKAQTEAMNTLRKAVQRIEAGWRQIDHPPEWTTDGFSVERKLDTFLREIVDNGDVEARSGKNTKGFLQGKSADFARLMGPTDRPATNLFARLYPIADEMAAAAIALSTICGWNLSIVRQLQVSDIETTQTTNSKTTYTITLRKPRRGATDTWTETYIDDGPLTKGRLINLLLRMTVGVRRTFSKTNDPRTELLAYIPLTMVKRSKHSLVSPLFTLNELDDRGFQNHLSNWLSKWDGLAGTRPSEYRKYFVSRNHPQAHSSEQNLSYVRDAGLSTDLIKRLSAGLSSAVGIDDITILDKETIIPDDLWGHRATPEQVESINSLTSDTGQSACIDPDHKPDTGSLCDSGFLTCFTCKNAVILRRHLPSCFALRDHLVGLSNTLAPGAWTQTHTNALAALNSILQRDNFFDSRTLDQAQNEVTLDLIDRARAITENRWLV